MGAVNSRRGPLLGRDFERGQLEAEVARAKAGELSVVLLEGEPGIGKTHLATDVLAGAGVLCLEARGYPLGSTSAFGLWVEALESHLRELHIDEVAALCEGGAGDLAALLPSVAAASGTAGSDVPAARLLEGLAVLMKDLSTGQTVAVLLDDLQWADASSWGALDYLAHNLRDTSVALVGCVRPGELSEPDAKHVLLRLEQEGILRRLPVGPLPENDLRDLAASVLGATAIPRGLVRAMHRRTGGNPLFALMLLETLAESGGGLSAPALASVPRSLAERVGARLEALASSELELIELLAVAGRRVGLEDLRRFGRRSPEALSTDLQSLVRVGLVSELETSSMVAYEITHPLIRDAVYERIGAARRRTLHRRIGRALQSLDALTDAAPHFARSADVGDEEAIGVLTEAARRAWSRQTFSEALVVMRSLLELLPAGDERWLDVLDVMSLDGDWLSYHGGDADYALGASIMRGIEPLLMDPADAGRLAAFNLHLSGFLAWGNGNLTEARRRGERAVDLFLQAGDESRARIASSELAWVVGVGGEVGAQERLAREVLAEAEQSGDRSAALFGMIALANTAWPQGRFEEAEEAFTRCTELAQAEGNIERARYGHAYLALSRALEGRLVEARASLEEANATDPAGAVSPAIEIGIFISWFCGELGAALAEVPPAAAELGVGRSWVLVIGALAAAEAGDAKGGRALLDELEEVIVHRRFWVMRTAYRWAQGLIPWREGQAEKATAELDELAEDLLGDNCISPAAFVLLDLCEAAWEASDEAIARSAADRLEGVATQINRPLYEALHGIAASWAALATDGAEEAANLARRAAELLPAGYRGLEGRALDVLGRGLAASDDRAGAVEAFERSAALFEACGSQWRRERTMTALASLGKRGRRAVAAAAGPASLTAREREAAALAVEGLTAKEIGERLYIGERTVETHLSNAYAKLGVRSRLQLARHADELKP